MEPDRPNLGNNQNQNQDAFQFQVKYFNVDDGTNDPQNDGETKGEMVYA